MYNNKYMEVVEKATRARRAEERRQAMLNQFETTDIRKIKSTDEFMNSFDNAFNASLDAGKARIDMLIAMGVKFK